MKISQETELDFDDVLIQPNWSTITSRSEIDVEREFFFYHSPRKWVGVPIMCANMASIAGFEMATALAKNKIITCLHKFIKPEEFSVLSYGGKETDIDYIWPSIGFSQSEKNRLAQIAKGYSRSPNICIDVPSAYMDEFVKYCKEIREAYPESIIMAGNVVSGDIAKDLILHGGVDIVKVGIGQGKNCSTRAVTGVGRPQLSATLDVAYNVHGLRTAPKHLGLMCIDGGLKYPGDIAKAYVAGADFAMLGAMFSGTSECCGEWEYENDYTKAYLKHYGMSTHYANEINNGYQKNYRASEGVVTKVPHKGPVQNTVNEILGGIRSCCSYIGATSIKEMSRCGRFVKVNRIHQDYGKQELGK